MPPIHHFQQAPGTAWSEERIFTLPSRPPPWILSACLLAFSQLLGWTVPGSSHLQPSKQASKQASKHGSPRLSICPPAVPISIHHDLSCVAALASSIRQAYKGVPVPTSSQMPTDGHPCGTETRAMVGAVSPWNLSLPAQRPTMRTNQASPAVWL